MIWLGIFIGAVIGLSVALLVADREIKAVESRKERYARIISEIRLIAFAHRLKDKAEKCEAWEEPCFFVSDIDEVLKEMVGAE